VSVPETATIEEFQAKLREILSANSQEVEEAIVARIRDNEVGVPTNPDALASLGLGATESIGTMIESFEVGLDWSPTLPPTVATYIRYLAREEVPMEAVMRVCSLVGGVFVEVVFSKLGDDEAKLALSYLAGWGSGNFDRLLNAFAAEYTGELERLSKSPTSDLRKRVGKQLRGAFDDAVGPGYRLDARHIALIVVGARGDLACRRLAEQVGADLLIVPDAEDTWWAWLGAHREIGFAELERALPLNGAELAVSVGEPRPGGNGWRLTHHEAQSALPIARLEAPGLVRYSNVALLASAFSDEATGRSLMDRYLRPLDGHRDADDLRQTLRTYFELNCNAVSTASSLGVNRHTVQRRLKRVEEAIGEPSSDRQAEFGVALRLEQLTERTRATAHSKE
jgi:PucR C-terminal helix-turn-helix domain